jgi:hypothetical protein
MAPDARVRGSSQRLVAAMSDAAGHELQHALEVLSHSSIRSGSAMTLLYKWEGSKEGGHFETDAAIKVGNAVRAELRASAAAELSAETAVAAGRETTIVVQVNDYEEVPPADLTEAESVATHIYEAIGVRVIWVHAEVPFADPRGVRVHVRLLSREMANRMIAKEKIKDDVLGEAIASTYGAYVFVDRIAPVVFQFAQPYTRVLGLVIAHEIGHILLPGQRHSESGIMSANVNLWSRKLVYFTLEQGTAIRSLLRRLATQ